MDSIDRVVVYPQVYAAGETWGISGSAFLWVYVPIALLAVAVGFRLRWKATGTPVEPPAEQLTAPETGMLFGDERAVMAAVALLRSHDLVDSTGAAVRRSDTRGPAGLDSFTLSVHERLDRSQQSIAATTRLVHGPLETLRADLVRRGYLAGDDLRRTLRDAGMPVAIIDLLGGVRFVAGLINGNPVVFLGIILVLMGLAWWRIVAPVRVTPMGRVARERAAMNNRHLRPSNSPSYTTYGPDAAAAAVAVYGAAALMVLDPALSESISAQQADGGSGGGDGGGGGGGGDGGGCGGCGGCGG